MILVGLLFTLLGSDAPFVDAGIEDVLEKAKAEKKLVFVDVYTDWCGPCKLLDKTTWKDEKVKAVLSDRMISIKINAEKGEGIPFARKYRVRGYPSLLVLNGNGELLDRHTGYIHPRQFLVWLEKNFDD